MSRIRERWPQEDFGKTIYIEQDNEWTHVNPEDEDLRAAASQHGFDIRLLCQPPNSLDLNISDLGFSAPFKHYNTKCVQGPSKNLFLQ